MSPRCVRDHVGPGGLRVVELAHIALDHGTIRPSATNRGAGENPFMATKTSATPKAATPKAPSKSKAVKAADLRSYQAKRASILLKHVSDPTRLQVILILSEGEQHVGALCSQLSQSQPAVSHHLALLRHGGIIAPRRQGKNNFYSLTDTGSDLAVVVKGLMNPA
jgi:DNA-binding transcriptional ArsR family regulator